ncbi:unnamed protein product [Somion occarium]|uniref:Uncharacterized protein n=1 Tax=Somion occarium TaxID=3059160 RepID=A0ABP1CMZ7_9APHY
MRSVDSDFPDRIFTKLCRYCQEMVRKSRQPLHDRADNKLYNTRDLPQESRAAHQPNLSQSSAQQLASLRDLQLAAASSSREPPEVAAARGSSSPSSLGATGAHTTDASTSQTRRRRETRETSRTLAGAQGSSRSRQPPSTDATDPAIAATRSNAPTDFTSKSMSSTPSVSQAHHQQSYPVQAGHPVGTQQQSVQRTRPPSTSQPASSQYSAYTSSHTSTVPFTSSQRAGDASGILQPGTVHDDRSRMGSQVLPQSQQARHHAPAPLYRFGSIDPGVEPSSHSGQASAQNASLVPSAQYTPGAVRQRASEQGIPPIPSAQAAHPERRMHVNPGVSSASASVSASIFAHHPLPSAVLTSGTSTYSPQQQQPGFYPSSTVAAGPSGPFNAHPGSSSHAGALHLGTSQGPASTNPTNVGSFPNLQQQFYNQNAGTLHDMTTLANALPAVPTSSSTSHTASYPPQRQIVVPPQSHGRPPLPPGQPQHNAANQYHPSSTRPPPSGNNYYNSAR